MRFRWSLSIALCGATLLCIGVIVLVVPEQIGSSSARFGAAKSSAPAPPPQPAPPPGARSAEVAPPARAALSGSAEAREAGLNDDHEVHLQGSATTQRVSELAARSRGFSPPLERPVIEEYVAPTPPPPMLPEPEAPVLSAVAKAEQLRFKETGR